MPNKESEPGTTLADGAEDIARAVLKIDAGLRKLNASGLTERAILTLINDVTGGPKHGVSKANIKKVLDGLGRLKAEYVK